MRSKTSFFNGYIYRSALSRFWPLWAAYAMLLFISTALPIMGADPKLDYTKALVTSDLMRSAWNIGSLLSFFMAAATAMAVFGYLYSPKQTGLMTSLPIKRGAMYLSCLSAGLTAMLASDVLIFLICIAAEAGMGLISMSYLWQWLAIMVMMNVTFYGFAAFCAMLTGNIIVLPLVYAVLGLTAWVVESLFRSLLEIFVFGMSMGGNVLTFLSPVVKISETQPSSILIGGSGGASYTITQITPEQWRLIGIYCAVGVVFAALGLLLYRGRRMETSTDVVAIGVLRPVFKYCMCVGCALVLSVWLHFNAFGNMGPGASFYVILALMLAGGFIGYFAADMMIKKTFHVFSHNWSGFIIASCAIAALMLCFRFDVFGYEKHVPDPSDVESAYLYVNGDNVEFLSPDNIAAAVDLQKSIIADKQTHVSSSITNRTYFRLNYIMKNGGTMQRAYYLNADAAHASDKNSDLMKLQSLINVQEAINFRKRTNVKVTEKNITSASISYYDKATSAYQDLSITPTQADELYNACIVPDTESGALGRLWVSTAGSDYYSKVYAVTIYINLYDSLNGGIVGSEKLRSDKYSDYFHTTLTVDAVNTLKWLSENTSIVPVMEKDANDAKQVSESVNGGGYTTAAEAVN